MRNLILITICLLFVPALGFAQSPPAVPVTDVKAETLLDTPPAPIQNMPEQNLRDSPAQPERENIVKSIPQKSSAPIQKQIGENIPLPLNKPVPDTGNNLMVIELFSTQACTFCPKADALMKQLSDRDNLIALSCHIDYFDVEQGSLSKPICSTRQIAYETTLGSGPKYTPQMVINGRHDAIGYLASELDNAFLKAQKIPVQALSIQTIGNLYSVSLPDIGIGQYKVWLLVFDQPHVITVASGANRGKEMTYYNIVSNAGYLGDWDGTPKALKFDAKMNALSKGFAVLIHDAKTNHIVAAAQYLK